MANARSARFEQLQPQDSACHANHLPDLRIRRLVSLSDLALGQFTALFGRVINGQGEVRSLGSLGCTYLRAPQIHAIMDEAYDPDFLADPVEGAGAYRHLQKKIGRFITRNGLHKPLAAPVDGLSIYGRSEPSRRRPHRILKPMIGLDLYAGDTGDRMHSEYDAIINYLGNEGYPVEAIKEQETALPFTPHVTIGRFYEHVWQRRRLNPNSFLSERVSLPGKVALQGVKPQYVESYDCQPMYIPRARVG